MPENSKQGRTHGGQRKKSVFYGKKEKQNKGVGIKKEENRGSKAVGNEYRGQFSLKVALILIRSHRHTMVGEPKNSSPLKRSGKLHGVTISCYATSTVKKLSSLRFTLMGRF